MASDPKDPAPLTAFKAVSDRAFSADQCFLCGKNLGEKGSREHVFPMWLQREFRLLDKRLSLLNRSEIPYRQLTIPCCEECNTVHLSLLENTIRTAFRGGFCDFRKLSRYKLFLWLSKIMYGVLLRESLLPGFITEGGSSPPIVSKHLLEEMHTLFLFLQGIRTKMTFSDFVPWSIFILRAHKSNTAKLDFDYKDSLLGLTICMRMNDIAVFCVLQDNGLQESFFGDYFEQFREVELQPIQIQEVFAMVTYRQSLRTRIPKYVSVDKGDEIQTLTSGSFVNLPEYRDWSLEQYAHILSFYTGIDFDDLFSPPDKIVSWLHSEDGNVRRL